MNRKTRNAYSKLGQAKYKLKNEPTYAERVFRKYLDEFGIPYNFQKGIVTSKGRGLVRIVDFYVPRVNIAFEVDGGYHNTNHQEINDFERELEIDKKKKNILFVRFTNYEIIKNPDYVKKVIKEVYNERLWDYMDNKRIGVKAKEKYKFL